MDLGVDMSWIPWDQGNTKYVCQERVVWERNKEGRKEESEGERRNQEKKDFYRVDSD